MRPQYAVTLAIAALAIAPAHAAAAPCAGADLAPTTANVATVEQATLCLLNQQRAAAGLAPVARNTQLDAASRAHSQDMVARKYFAHDTPNGVTFVSRETSVGYITDSLWSWNAGENIAWGMGSLAPASAIMTAWMNSQHHRDNILDPDFKEIGVGVVLGVPVAGSGSGATYTTDFGARVMDTSSSATTAATKAKKAKRAKKAKKAKRCSTAARRRANKAARSKKTRSKKALRCATRAKKAKKQPARKS